jgi:hypothetical protein
MIRVNTLDPGEHPARFLEYHVEMASVVSIWCIGQAKFVKEVSPLVDNHARVRWIADGAALERSLSAPSDCSTVIVEHSINGGSLSNLQYVQAHLPGARRLVVVDACELKIVRSYLETGAATEIIYRPLDRVTLLRSCGIANPASTKRSASIPSTASSHA